MKYLPMIFVLGTLFSMAIIGCQQSVAPIISHKLVVTRNQHAVPMWPDEQTYLHTSHEKQQGGVVGVVGDVKENLTAKQLDDQTPVQVVSTDDNGAVVTVTDGPMKGATGFVPKQNVD
jgi:precorrin-4 methylase